MVFARVCSLAAVLLVYAAAQPAHQEAARPNATDEVAEAQKAMHDAIEEAEAKIAKLENRSEDMKAQLHSKALAIAVAEGIQAKVHARFAERRRELNSSFERELLALDPATAAAANSSEVKEAVGAAKRAIAGLKDLNEAEMHEMRAGLTDLSHAGKEKAKSLWREARMAAKQAYHSGMRAAKAQREAGLSEDVYERSERAAERAGERLRQHAEGAAERAEGLTERQYGEVERRLERMIDEASDEQGRALDALRERLRRARRAAEEARRAAAEERAARERAGGQPAALMADLLATNSTTAAPDPAQEAEAAMRNASAHAEAIIAKLESWIRDLKVNIHDANFARAVAQGIQSNVQQDFADQREDLNRSFAAAIEALNASGLNASEVEERVGAAKRIIKQTRKLNRQEAKETRAALGELEKSGRSKAKKLEKEGKAAAKQAFRFGKALSRAQHAAGLHEHIYERTIGHAEHASERLEHRAEHAAEKAEDVLEHQSGQVEHHLEKLMDELSDEESRAVDELYARLHHAQRSIEEARRTPMAAAEPLRSAPAVLLEQSSSQDLTVTFIAPLACVAMTAGLAMLLVNRHGRRSASMEQPLLA